MLIGRSVALLTRIRNTSHDGSAYVVNRIVEWAVRFVRTGGGRHFDRNADAASYLLRACGASCSRCEVANPMGCSWTYRLRWPYWHLTKCRYLLAGSAPPSPNTRDSRKIELKGSTSVLSGRRHLEASRYYRCC